MIFVPIALLNKIDSLQDIRTVIIEPAITAEMIGFSVVVGAAGGLFLKYTVRKKFYSGAPWDRFGNEYLSKYVFLYTVDGKMYRGWVKRIARGKEEKKEICLGDPEVLTKDAVGIKQFVKMGDEMYFPESSVQKILRRQ
jgi:hypothetical protein